MIQREEILRSNEYWLQNAQLDLYSQVSSYMKREDINQTELAEKLNVSKGRVSQILNGEFNHTLKKLIEVGLAIGVVPRIVYDQIDDVIKKDKQIKSYYDLVKLEPEKDNIIPFWVNKDFYSSFDTIEESLTSDSSSFNLYNPVKNAPSFSTETLNLLAK